MQVVIVGGSLAGLMHAIVLKSLGHDVRVLEKSSKSRLQSQAAGIGARNDVQTVIDTYVKPQQPYSKAAAALEVVNEDGTRINCFPTDQTHQLTTWSLLHALFTTRLLNKEGPTATYETDTWVQEINPRGEKLIVRYLENTSKVMKEIAADLVIAADGAQSHIRKTIFKLPSPQYAGFVTWRGTVPASLISGPSRKFLEDRLIGCRTDNGYIVTYYVPSENGSTSPEDCQFIWVWYQMLEETSLEYEKTLTDKFGTKHSTTIPRTKVHPDIWAQTLERSRKLDLVYAELIQKTTDPFVSAIRDSPARQCVTHDGKLLLVGDAFAQHRPHAGMGTNQAAYQALELGKVFEGKQSLQTWESNSIAFSKKAAAITLGIGEYFFSGQVPPVLSATLGPDTLPEHIM